MNPLIKKVYTMNGAVFSIFSFRALKPHWKSLLIKQLLSEKLGDTGNLVHILRRELQEGVAAALDFLSPQILHFAQNPNIQISFLLQSFVFEKNHS